MKKRRRQRASRSTFARAREEETPWQHRQGWARRAQWEDVYISAAGPGWREDAAQPVWAERREEFVKTGFE
eukprot:831527-Pyramimonas_sp.AAC.1